MAKSANHGAFPATFQGETLGNTQADKGNKKTNECLCGEMHRFKDCPYIVESVRPVGWKPNKDTQQLVEGKIQGNTKLKTIIGRIRKGSQKDQTDLKTPGQPSQPNQSSEPAGFATVYTTAVQYTPSHEIYPLRDSYILGSGATVHVCNNPARMKDF